MDSTNINMKRDFKNNPLIKKFKP